MILLRKILYIISLCCALLLGLTYIPAFIPQDIFSKLSLLGYLYPFLLIINAVFILIWLFVKPRHILIPLFFILIRFNYVPRLVNVHSSSEGGELKVMTYNVKDFIHKMEKRDAVLIGQRQDSILAFIASSDPQVICLQDYDVNITWKKGFHNYLVDTFGYNHFYYYNIKRKNINNCAIYSKYPITQAGSVLPDDAKNYSYIFADIKTPVNTVRVYNLHLESYKLGEQEKSDYTQIMHGKVSDTASKNIINKLLTANKQRAKQIKEIIPEIERQQKAVIVCGDFNDHPFSNTYKRFNDILTDAFVSCASGIGRTYNGVFPAYRIDYIWYEKSRLEAVNYASEALDLSDHYPVTVTFNIKRQ